MPTDLPAAEPQEEVTEAERGAAFFTCVAAIVAILTTFFVYMATGNIWWAAAVFFDLVTLASIAFAAANVVAIPAEKFAQQMQKQQEQLGFALYVAPDQPPTPQASPPKPPNP